jgi:acetyl-CoA synthetase
MYSEVGRHPSLSQRNGNRDSACLIDRLNALMSDEFKVARDFLLANRTAYDVANQGFRWPKLERFNWALDWFDAIAAGERRDQLALCVVFEDGKETKLTFGELSNCRSI